MIIENTRFGTIEIEDEKIITMTRSMLGFPEQKRFVILNRKESHPFLWYQCVDDPHLAFVILSPYLFKSDYSIDFKAIFSEMSWEADEKENLAVFVVVNASNGVPEKMTANLMAPLLINIERFEAAQVVFQDNQYSHKYPIFTMDNNLTASKAGEKQKLAPLEMRE